MTQEQISEVIRTLNTTDLDAIKKMIAQEERSRYDQMWWTHDRVDNYLYYVFYEDGSYWMHCIASKVYNEFIKNDKAVCIKRKTKDLFPVWETMIEKERNEA